MSDERAAPVQNDPDSGIWPNRVTVWVCPVCGARVTGTYNVNEGLKKCSKETHKAMAQGRQYEIVPTALPELIASVEEVAITSLRYCEEKYDHDDQARLNVEAAVREAKRAL